MANAQLADYVKQQVAKGMSADSIQKALKGVGWPDADIKEAMGVMGAPAGASPAASPVASSSASPSMSPSMGDVKAPAKAAAPGGASMAVAATASPAFKVSEMAFNPQPKSALSSAGLTSNPFNAAPSSGGSSSLSKIALVVLAVLFVAAAAVAFMMYRNGSGASAKIASLSAQNDSLTAQLAAAKNTSANSDAQLAALTAQMSDLASQLALFSITPGATGTMEAAIDAKGTLGGGSGKPYTILTSRNILATVKNWKDKQVDAALKPLLGTMVTISGNHMQGSPDITALKVNGAPIFAPPAAASSTSAATSTTGR